jgi:hypothetical protein
MNGMKSNISNYESESEYHLFPIIKSSYDLETAMIADATTFTDEKTGKVVRYADYRDDIFRIEHFVQDMIKRNDPGFRHIQVNPELNKPSKIDRYEGSQFIRPMYTMFRNLRKRKPKNVRFSEYIELYFETISEMKLEGMLLMDPEVHVARFEPFYISVFSKGQSMKLQEFSLLRYGDLFNQFVKRIKAVAASPEFKTKLRRRIARSKENHESGSIYIDSLFETYSRLIIVRVDFYYLFPFAHELTIEEAQKDRERFLNNRRNNQLFEHLAGYIWKLEDGEEKGLHFHFIFFIDGSYKENASFYADKYGKYWAETITKGRGYYHNCHTSNTNYKRYCIGAINHYEADKRANLKGGLLKYITKTSQHVRVIGCRVFGHGEIPRKPISKSGKPIGRPRKYDS